MTREITDRKTTILIPYFFLLVFFFSKVLISHVILLYLLMKRVATSVEWSTLSIESPTDRARTKLTCISVRTVTQ